MNEKEGKFIKFTGHQIHKGLLKNYFFLSRKTIDKALKVVEGNYNIQLLNNLETLQTNNPKEFWNKIRNLGLQKQNVNEKVEIHKELFENSDRVLDKWASEFENLLMIKQITPILMKTFITRLLNKNKIGKQI